MTENSKESIAAKENDEKNGETEEAGGNNPKPEETDENNLKTGENIDNSIGNDSIETEEAAADAVETEEAAADIIETEEVPSMTASQVEEGAQPENWNIDLLLDVELPVRVSFGQTEMQLRDVFKLGAGSIIELDKSVNDPVAVIVNNKTIARGEVVMVDGNYGVRILEVDSTAERIRSLG